jgi:hypothetical protein
MLLFLFLFAGGGQGYLPMDLRLIRGLVDASNQPRFTASLHA